MQKKWCTTFNVLGMAVITLVSMTYSPKAATAFFKTEPVVPAKIVNPLPAEKSYTPSFKLVGSNPVTQIGVGSPSIAISKGSALPLEVAIKMILPKGWSSINKADKALFSQKVHWKNNKTWVNTLRSIGDDYNIRFLIDWNQKTVYVGESSPNTPIVLTLKKNNITNIPKIQRIKEDPVKPAPLVTPTITPQKKKLPAGNIENNLSTFFHGHGYRFKMKAPAGKEFKLEFPLFLTGQNFEDELVSINKSLNQNSQYSFSFHVYEKNEIVKLIVQKK
jgi:hypothetical protein